MRQVWQQVPLGWADAPQVIALAEVLKRRDPRLFLIDLWDWAKRHGCEVEGPQAVTAIERGAGWTGKRGAFVAACMETGWLEEDGETLRVVPWDEVLSIDWSTARGEQGLDQDEADALASRREAARRRQQERRARLRAKREASRMERDSHTEERDTKRDSHTTERDMSHPNARARTKTKTKTLKNSPISPHRGQLAPTEDPTKPNTEKPASPKPKPKALDDPRITEVLQYWQTAVGCEQRSIEDLKRRRRIRARLDEGFSVEQLKACADGAARDDWLMGRDPRSNGRDYRDVQTVYRDRPQVERLIELAEKPIESIRTDSNGKPIPLGINEGHKIYEANNPIVLEGPDPWDVEEELVEAAQ